MKIFTQTFKIFTLAMALFGMSAGVMGQAVDILPKLYLSSKNTPVNHENWVIVDSPTNNSNTDYWKMVQSTSSITTPTVDLTKYTNIEIRIGIGTFGTPTATGQANVKIEHFDGTNWTEVITLGKPANSSSNPFTIPLSTVAIGSKIKLSTPNAGSSIGARIFYVELKGTLITTSPYITTPSSLEFEKITINSSTQSLFNIKGSNLTSDLTISGLTAPFSSTVTTITKEQAMAEGGFDVPVIFAPTTKGNHSATLTISGGGLTNNVDVSINGSAYAILEAASIAYLRAQYTGTAVSDTRYKLTSEAIVTFEYIKNRGQYYIQDATGAILIDDATRKITTQFDAGDGITNLQGTFTTYKGVLQFVPAVNATKTTTGNVLTPKLITPTQLATGDYESQLVKIDGITIEGSEIFAADTEYPVTNETFKVKTFNLTYTEKLSSVKNIIGIAGKKTEGTPSTTTFLISPRSDADLINVPTAIETPTLAEGSIFVSNGQIVVKAETAGALIEVYNIGGQRLVSKVAEAGRNTITLAKGQIYVVKVGNLVKKVVL